MTLIINILLILCLWVIASITITDYVDMLVVTDVNEEQIYSSDNEEVNCCLPVQ